HALQGMLTSVDEDEAGACGELARRCADEELSRVRALGDPARDVQGYPTGAALDLLHLAGVSSRPDGEPEVRRTSDDRKREADRASRAVERTHEAVACRVELLAAEAHELALDRAELCGDQLSPIAITQPFDEARRADDVGRQHGPDRTVGARP